ncbi:MAG: aminopeptidase [Thermoleophilia bacterium]
MRDYTDLTRRLADLIVGYGANVQPGQLVGITSYLGKEELTREIARAAYERGARYVDVLYWDHWVKRQRLLHGDPATFDYIPPWMNSRMQSFSDEHSARIALSGAQALDALAGIPAERTGIDSLPSLPSTGEIVNLRTTNWCVAPAPTKEWATAVYPDAEPDDAYARLWDAIAHVCRLDTEDPVVAWNERFAAISQSAAALTARRFDAIRLHGPGTDLTVGLFASSRWQAAGFSTVDGLHHFPNIPSEETFTTPDPLRVDGHVSSTMPLELYGSIVSGIRIEFEAGRAVKINADANADTLRSACAKDDGGTRLGELALVDGLGRIGPLETVFFDTLLDENAASHIALGSAFEEGVGDETDKQQANRSQIHIDFMIGSPSVAVDGVTRDGEHVPLLRNGTWQI